MRFLGIPISKPLYGIYWLLTNAQIELLVSDVSIIVSNPQSVADKKDKKHRFRSPSASELEEVSKRWREKYQDGKPTINISDYIPQTQ